MDRSNLSLKWLEVFQAVARSGSVQDAAGRLGLTVSTVSHHLTCLEEAVGKPLIDHRRRPMRLTDEGTVFLRRVDEALLSLRQGLTDVWAEDLSALSRRLTLAATEDFDTEVTPRLVAALAEALPLCELSVLSRPSHEILSLLHEGEADIGISAPGDLRPGPDLIEEPLLRDPFVLIVPRDRPDPAADYLSGAAGLPLLRYSRRQLIGRRIDLQFRRLGLQVPGRMEFESTLSMLSLVGEGRGWTVTSALNYARAARLHARIRPLPFPARAFSRQVSLFREAELHGGIADLVRGLTRELMQARVIDPLVAAEPWLAEEFRLL